MVAQRHRLQYGERAPVESVTTALADHVQESTQTAGSRPFGAALLVAGVDPTRSVSTPKRGTDEADGTGHLFEVEPGGTPYGWQAVGIGDATSDLRERLEDVLETTPTDELTASDGVSMALGALAKTDNEPNPSAYECLTIGRGSATARRSTAEIADVLENVAS